MAQVGVAIRSPRTGYRWWRSVAARAMLAFVVLAAALSLLLIAGRAIDVRNTEERAIASLAEERADALVARLETGALDAHGFAEGAAGAGYAYAYLRDASGRVIAGAVPALDGDGPAAPGLSGRIDGGVVHVVRSLEVAGAPMTLGLGLSLASAVSAAKEAAARGLIAAFAFLALSLPALALLADRTAAPMRALVRAARSPGLAETALRLAVGRSDEIGTIARAHAAYARDLAENADALHRLTFDDAATRLPNRESFMRALVPLLQLERPAALLEIEVNGLDRIASALGQQTGDEAVRRVAERLSAATDDCARRAGLPHGRPLVLARTSDAGFGLIAPDADVDAARALSEALIAALDAPIPLDGINVSPTLAIGVALAPQDGQDAASLLRNAFAAVSAARGAGPRSVRFAGAELSRVAYGRLKLEEDLRRAISGGAIELHYQPQIRLSDGLACGAEALTRWRHATRGMIPPMEFIPVAEESGLIEPLGRLVLAEASRKTARWRAQGVPLRVSVNVSPIQFGRVGFAAAALRIIDEAGADPASIELEITESAAMADPAHAARELAPLKAEGVRIAIDDFGTGYSNLATLTRLPFDVLKIDRAFVLAASKEPGALAVVHAVIGLARNLGFETVAEGVETEEQLDLVTSLGATHAQGYLFGKPMAAEAFEAWRLDRRVAELRRLADGAQMVRANGALRA